MNMIQITCFSTMKILDFDLSEYVNMLRLNQMASVLEVVTMTIVTFFVLIYTCLNNNNQYEAW